ncbi:uncharacterized protein PV09_02618 [Verruconis gallopava]|uniref:L-ornithine N(5)-oxygenase n=1 Tax=Verruconis gallopava TaxID=253628 RepID=A0A0D2B6W7_9PEZI|nr:uncharacterized protein PV09_02618 [Verruconis gallopava]KIW06959.1 hypothetical protein PV09_02618 [Verruconis gallopava]
MTSSEAGKGYHPIREDLRTQIHRVNGYDRQKGYTYYPVVVVGAGFAGIAMAWKLQVELKFDQYRVFERQSGVGGTWWINRYPGVACDVPAVFYSYSFAPNPKWTSMYPPGPEIYNYLQDICDEYNLTDKIELNTDVRVCKWLPQEECWEVQLAHMKPGMGDLSSKERARRVREEGEDSVWVSTETIRCKILISGVGGIVEPKGAPSNIKGFEKFKGVCFHSARWDDSVDFQGKDVVVLGTGCSSAQLVPRLTKAPFNAKSVTQIMRSPPWVVSKLPPPGGDEGWAKWAPVVFTYVPGALRAMRLLLASVAEFDWRLFPDGEWNKKQRAKLEAFELKRMKSIVPEKYHDIMTPDYSIGCKRRIFDAEWLTSLNEPNIELTTLKPTEIHERSITLGPEVSYPKDAKPGEAKEVPADIIVLANGFDMTRWLSPLEVRGTHGQDLVDTMQERGGPQAYLGTAVDGFPNFFIIFGPNTTTGHSSVVLAIENMVNHAKRFIKPILNGDVRTVEVKKEAEIKWAQDIQRELKKTVFQTGGCNSWYFDETGWNSTVLPYNQIWFWYKCRFPKWSDWTISYTRKGLIKLVLSRLVKFIGVMSFLFGWYRARQEGLSLKEYVLDSLQRLKGYSKLAALLAIMQLQKQLKKASKYIMNL